MFDRKAGIEIPPSKLDVLEKLTANLPPVPMFDDVVNFDAYGKISNGGEGKVIFKLEGVTIIYWQGKSGDVIQLHSHVEEERIIVCKGGMELKVHGRAYKNIGVEMSLIKQDSWHLVCPGHIVILTPMCPHTASFSEETSALAILSPAAKG